jgi:putative MATE family efflux protein
MAAPAKFVEGSLFRHVTVMALTASVGLMAIFAVDLINLIYISMLGQAELAAAIGFAGAILFFTSAFGIGMGVGVGALVARALGAGDREAARERATTGMVWGVTVGAVIAAVVWMFLPPLVSLLGATGETHALAVHYLTIVMPSQPLLMVGMIGGAILRSHGAARLAMMTTVWGAIVTAVLDPILIFGAGLDLTGAALASVGGRIAIAVVAIRPILRAYGGFAGLTPARMLAGLPALAAIAVPAILTQVATPVGQALITRAMADFGEAAVAGMAIAGRLTPVAFGVIFALSGAVGPIIGQNLGAGRMDRVRAAFRAALLFTALVIAGVSAVLFLLRGPIADLFGATGVTRDLVYLFCGPLALLWFFNGVIFVGNAACNNLGRPFWSTVVNWGRHTAGTVPFLWWGAAAMGPQGVLIGPALGGVVFGLLSWWLALRAIANPAAGVVPAAPAAMQAVQAVPGEAQATHTP